MEGKMNESVIKSQKTDDLDGVESDRRNEPIVLAIVFGVTDDGRVVFIHEGTVGRLRIPLFPVAWHSSSDDELDTGSSEVTNDVFVKFHKQTGFQSGELSIAGSVRLHEERAWVIIFSWMSVPQVVQKNVHLLDWEEFNENRDRLASQDPVLSACIEMVCDELERCGVIDKVPFISDRFTFRH